MTELYRTGTLGVPLPPNTFFGFSNFITTDLTNYAAFGQADVNVSSALRLIVGARYTHEEQDLLFTRARIPGTLAFPGAGPLAAPINDTISNGALTWRLGAQYDVAPEVMLYATATRGFKGGGYNALPEITQSRRVRPEIPTNFEIGLKGSLFDRALSVNAALFHTRFKDFQAQALVPSTTPGGLAVLDVTNAGTLRTRGLELDIVGRPIPALTIAANYAYIDAEYGSFPNAACYPGQTVAQGCVLANGVSTQNLSGRRLNNAPEHVFNISANYDIVLPKMPFDGFAYASYYYRSEVNFAQSLYPKTQAEGYGILNATLGIRSRDERYTLSLFVKNLFDTKFVGSIFSTPFDGTGTSQFPVYEARRIFGIQAGVKL
jgi:iron complex outermembrane receptor protein